VTGDYPEVHADRRGRGRAVLIVVLGAVLVVGVAGVTTIRVARPVPVMAATSTDTGGAVGGAASTTLPDDPVFDQAVAVARQRSPKPSYPPAQRTAIVDSFAALSDCMHNNGVGDYPQLPANFGDGTVAQPVLAGRPGTDLDGSSPQFQRAVAACGTENEAVRSATLIANGHPELVGK